MTCPPEIAEIVTEIIKVAILQVRSAGWSGDANRCAIEADHVHNLPELLNHYSREALRYYWEVEKPAFASQTPAAELTAFLPLWEKLGGVLARHADLALAR